MSTPIVAIIGSGLGGLVCGAVLAKQGYRVRLYEKNKQIGGCLQTFSRDKAILDSGVHYIGGLDKGGEGAKEYCYDSEYSACGFENSFFDTLHSVLFKRIVIWIEAHYYCIARA